MPLAITAACQVALQGAQSLYDCIMMLMDVFIPSWARPPLASPSIPDCAGYDSFPSYTQQPLVMYHQGSRAVFWEEWKIGESHGVLVERTRRCVGCWGASRF